MIFSDDSEQKKYLKILIPTLGQAIKNFPFLRY